MSNNNYNNKNANHVPLGISSDEEAKITSMAESLARQHNIKIQPVVFLRQALLDVLRHDPSAFDAMLTIYKDGFVNDKIRIGGMDEKKSFLEYFDISLPLAGNIVPQLSCALFIVALISQRCILEISRTGGGEEFAKKYGRTINIRKILEGIKIHHQTGESLDARRLKIERIDSDLIPVFLPRPADTLVNVSPEIPQEPQLEKYRAVLPDDTRIASDTDTPVDFQGKHYVRIENHVYEVHIDVDRGAWIIRSDDATQGPVAVHYQDGVWQLRTAGYLAPPAAGTPLYTYLSMLDLQQLQAHQMNVINSNRARIIERLNLLMEQIGTARGVAFIEPPLATSWADRFTAVNMALSAYTGNKVDFNRQYEAILKNYNTFNDTYAPDTVEAWRAYRNQETTVIPQMGTFNAAERQRIQHHLANNAGVNIPGGAVATAPLAISTTGDITGAHMKGSFVAAITKTVPGRGPDKPKILGYRTYAHVPGVIQVSYLMPGDPGYADTAPPARNGLHAPPAAATTAGSTGVPAAITQGVLISNGHPAWHIYDAGGPYAPAPSPSVPSRANPRLKTIFDPEMVNSIIRDTATTTAIDQYMGYVTEVMDSLRNGRFLRTEYMRYNVPIPSLSGTPAGDIRMVVYFGRAQIDPANPNNVQIRANSAYINANSPALAVAFTDVVSSGLPMGPSPGDLGNDLLRNPADLNNFVTAIRGTAATTGTDGQSKWVFQLDAAAVPSARELFLQDPHRSELILWNSDGTHNKIKTSLKWNSLTQSLIVDAIPSPVSGLKLTLVVSAPDAGADTFGGRTIAELADHFRALLINITKNDVARAAQIDVELVGCSIEPMNSPAVHLSKILADGLRARVSNLGIDLSKLTFTTRQYAQRNTAGHGQEVYVPARGWVTDAAIVADNDRHKSVWRYDTKSREMISAVLPHRLGAFRNLVERLYRGLATTDAFTPEENQLLQRFLTVEKIQQLSSNSEQSDILHRATQILITQYTLDPENIFDGRAVFTQLEIAEKARFTEKVVSLREQIRLWLGRFKPLGSLSGGASLEQWGWTEPELRKFVRDIEKKTTTPASPEDSGEMRWIVQMQGDSITSAAARALFLNHLGNSELMLWNQNKIDSAGKISLRWDKTKQSLVTEAVSSPQGRLNILFVGHGPAGGEGESSVFGGRNAYLVKRDFARMLASIRTGSVSHIDITLVGCRLVDLSASKNSLIQQLADMLLVRGGQLGISPENLNLGAFQHYIRIMPNGKGEAYIPGRGWLTENEVIATDKQYKSVWRYDNNAKCMLPDMPFVRFYELADRIGQKGQVFFNQLSDTDKHLVRSYLPDNKITELSQRNQNGERISKALQAMVEKFAGSREGIEGTPGGIAALVLMMDNETRYWLEMAETLGVSPDPEADKKAGEIIVSDMNRQQKHGDNVAIPGDSDTLRSLGLRVRVLGKLQSVIGYTSKGMLGLGAIAAISRIKIINDRLKSEILSEIERKKLNSEKNIALAELGVDLSDEAIMLVNSKKIGVDIIRAFKGTDGRGMPAVNLGKRLTSGLRVFAGAAGTVLSLAGTALAWYSIHSAWNDMQEFKALEKKARTKTEKEMIAEKLTQIQVNLGVNIATAIISSGLTLGTIVSLIAGMAGAAKLLAIATSIMSVAGPIGGAILVGAFIGLWIYNGINTVQEFSRHIALTGWDKFELGFGSLFGSVPLNLQREYDASKLKRAVEETLALERKGVFDSMPVEALYQFRPEVVPGKLYKEKIYVQNYVGTIGGTHGGSYIYLDKVAPPQRRHNPIDVDMDAERYEVIVSGNRERLNRSELIHVKPSREESEQELGGYLLDLWGHEARLYDSWHGWPAHVHPFPQYAIDHAQPQVLQDILDAQPDARVFASNEEKHMVVFCIHDLTPQATSNTWPSIPELLSPPSPGKISFFKFHHRQVRPATATSRAIYEYKLEASMTTTLPAGLWLGEMRNGSGVFFNDMDGDGLSDLVTVSQGGFLQVARQQRDGNFALMEKNSFSIYRENTLYLGTVHNTGRRNLSFSGHKILGFGATARTLYSRDRNGKLWSHTVVPGAMTGTGITMVNLNRGKGVPDGQSDSFTASLKQDAGSFIFSLGGGRQKKVSGGVNNDSFVLLDDNTVSKLDGKEGKDTLDFSQLSEKTVLGVTVDASKGKASIKLIKGSAQRKNISFSNMENFIGTKGADTLKGDNKDNIIDGVNGIDTIDAGDGNDVLRGVQGTFNGGAGIDKYQLGQVPADRSIPLPGTNTPAGTKKHNEYLKRVQKASTIDLVEDYSKGEDSYVSLVYRINEIKSITPEDSKHLLIVMTDGVQYRLNNFYTNSDIHEDGKMSAWYFTTVDGFSFRLETAASAPASKGDLRDIPVIFQSNLTDERLAHTSITLCAGAGDTGARVDTSEKMAGGVEGTELIHTIHLPSLFKLELHHMAGTAGMTLKGNKEADTWLIEGRAGGVVTIDSFDTSSAPKQDTLILSWKLSETQLSIKGNGLSLLHASHADSYTKISLSDFMNPVQSRYLTLVDFFGQTAELFATEGKAYLASGPLKMKTSRLEVFTASQGNLIINGASRILAEGDKQSTVIIDRSGTGNFLYGTYNAGNYLEVFAGENHLYGNNLTDELRSGSGKDSMAGGGGNDFYHVKGSATILDTEGEDTLILAEVKGVVQEELCLRKTEEGHLSIGFYSSPNRTITIQGYYNDPSRRIEHIVTGNFRLSHNEIDDFVNKHYDICAMNSLDDLVNGMGSMPVSADSIAMTGTGIPSSYQSSQLTIPVA